MELKLYVSNVTPILLFHIEEGATSINTYKVKNTRKLKKLLLQRETSAVMFPAEAIAFSVNIGCDGSESRKIAAIEAVIAYHGGVMIKAFVPMTACLI